MSITPGYVTFRMAMEISPIILTGGIASSLGGALPIIALTESIGSLLSGAASAGSNPLAGIANTTKSLFQGLSGADTALDSFFAHYMPLPGGSLIANQAATYPFANQAIAANAIIAQPLNVSLKMICPAKGILGYPLKLAIMSSLQQSLIQHNSLGGTYSVITPSYIYTYCILLGLRDISGGESNQAQYAWQWDFFQPLVSQAAANQALNGLMQTLSNGTQVSGTPTWAGGSAIGNPTSALTQSLAQSIVH